jgi:hypothetical protein
MPAPTLPVTPVPSDDPKKKKKDLENDKGSTNEALKDAAKLEDSEELVSDQLQGCDVY